MAQNLPKLEERWATVVHNKNTNIELLRVKKEMELANKNRLQISGKSIEEVRQTLSKSPMRTASFISKQKTADAVKVANRARDSTLNGYRTQNTLNRDR